MKMVKRVLTTTLCALLFLGVFSASALTKLVSLITGSGYSLQGEEAKSVLAYMQRAMNFIRSSYSAFTLFTP